MEETTNTVQSTAEHQETKWYVLTCGERQRTKGKRVS